MYSKRAAPYVDAPSLPHSFIYTPRTDTLTGISSWTQQLFVGLTRPVNKCNTHSAVPHASAAYPCRQELNSAHTVNRYYQRELSWTQRLFVGRPLRIQVQHAQRHTPHVYTHVHRHTYILNVYLSIYLSIDLNIYMHTYIYIHILTYIYICVCMYIYIYICVYIYMCVCVCVCVCER